MPSIVEFDMNVYVYVCVCNTVVVCMCTCFASFDNLQHICFRILPAPILTREKELVGGEPFVFSFIPCTFLWKSDAHQYTHTHTYIYL